MSAPGDRYARRYALLTALRWFPVGLMVPVLILLMQARGLDLAQAGRLMAVYSVVALILELPTGGLADVLGRRMVLAGASLLSAVGAAGLGLAASPALMVAAVAALGAGRALASGPLEAWYVDATRREDPEADIRTGISRAQAAESVALAVGSVIGGLLPALAIRTGLVPADGTVDAERMLLPLSVPLLVAAVMLVVHAVAVLALATEHRPVRVPAAGAEPGGATVGGTVRAGVGLVLRGHDLRRLVGYAALLGVGLGGVELVSPAAFSALLGGPEEAGSGYGLLVGLGFGAAALGAVLAPAAVRRAGTAHRAALVLALMGAAIVLLIAAPLLAVAGAGFLAFYLVLGTNGPILAGLLHDRVPSAQRSTVLSAESLAVQLGGVVASLAIGALVAASSPSVGYAVICAALALGGLLLRGIGPQPRAASVHGLAADMAKDPGPTVQGDAQSV